MNPSTVLNEASSTGGSSSVMEFSIRVPKNQKKKYNIMRFGSNLGVDFTNWAQVKMDRENSKGERSPSKEIPKFGAGSEYRKEEKEEARRKRYSMSSKRHSSVEQPWILKIGDKNGKKFRGVRGGGVGDNASYYLFMHGAGNTIEAHSVSEWYNFSAFQRFKALSAEEAEQEYGKRNKNLAFVSNLMRKCLHKDEDGENDEEVKRKGAKSLKISDMDDWIDNSISEDSDDEKSKKKFDDDDDLEDKKKKKAKKNATEQKKKVVDNDESAFEESDDGDEEGRELDYISDSSESVSDVEAKIDKEMTSVAEESGLRKLLASDEEDEDEEGKEKEEKNDEETSNKSEGNEKKPGEEDIAQQSWQKKAAKRKLSPSPNKSNKTGETSDEGGADDTDSDAEKNNSNNGHEWSSSYKPPMKKQTLDFSSGDNGISEDAVRRYLSRKPMTTTELLQKFKKPRTNLSSQQLVNSIAQILKKINPIKQTIKDKMYLSVKSDFSLLS